MSRKLASVQRIEKVEKHPNADRLDIVTIQGWRCVTKRGEFREGSRCVYFEIDSLLPDGPSWSEFMRDRKFRVRTIKLRGEISQGLALPDSELGAENFPIGKDVSEFLGVKKYDPELSLERANPTDLRKKKVKTRPFPPWIPKTDEPRIQSNLHLLESIGRNETLRATVKLDGASITFWREGNKVRVCSRNLELDPIELRVPWWKRLGRALGLMKPLKYTEYHEALLREVPLSWPEGVVFQGELCGPKIQKNPLKLSIPKVFIFDVFHPKTQSYFPPKEFRKICLESDLTPVPTAWTGTLPDDNKLDFLLLLAKGDYPCGGPREGIVVRLYEPDFEQTLRVHNARLSFKVINNDFLLKED